MGISKNKSVIVFAEGCDANTIVAASNLAQNNICKPLLLGDVNRINSIAQSKGLDLET